MWANLDCGLVIFRVSRGSPTARRDICSTCDLPVSPFDEKRKSVQISRDVSFVDVTKRNADPPPKGTRLSPLLHAEDPVRVAAVLPDAVQLDGAAPRFGHVFVCAGRKSTFSGRRRRFLSDQTCSGSTLNVSPEKPAHSPEKRTSVLALSSFRPSGFMRSQRGLQSARRVASADG